MAIEVKVKESVQNECPKLMINTEANSIILAVKINNIGIEGVCIKSSESANIGEYASNWRALDFHKEEERKEWERIYRSKKDRSEFPFGMNESWDIVEHDILD